MTDLQAILDAGGPWQQARIIGDQLLIQGDCLESLPRISGVSAIVMDPPYNFSTASSGGKHALWADAVNSAFWFSAVLSACKSRLSSGGLIWQFLNWKTFIPAQKACWDAGLKFESLLVWDKQWIGPGGPVGLRPSYELVALMAVGEARLKNRGLPDIWQSQWASQRPSGHPAEKPLDLIERIVRETDASVTLDPFMGSGTTLVACQRLGRQGIGIELDPDYFEIACKRVQEVVNNPPLFTPAPPKPTQEAMDL